jgi:hypothetical protein
MITAGRSMLRSRGRIALRPYTFAHGGVQKVGGPLRLFSYPNVVDPTDMTEEGGPEWTWV